MSKLVRITYQAASLDVPLWERPQSQGAQVGMIAQGSTVEAIEREYRSVRVNGLEGWAETSLLKRITPEPDPDLEVFNHGYKRDGVLYRYFFAVSNEGLGDFAGDVTLRLYNGDQLLAAQSFTFADRPMPKSGARKAMVEVTREATRFEFITSSATCQGTTKGRLKD